MTKGYRIHVGVWALAVTSFAIGIAEFIVVGVLPTIATDLDISLAQAGGLIGLYAFSLAIGTPIVVLGFASVPRKVLLLAFIALFMLGNLVSAIASSYALLLIGRILTAIAHGSFFAIGATVAARLSPTGHASRSIAVMFGGLTLAMVIGVPMGSLVGNAFGWRLPFLAVVGLSFLAFIGTAKWVPKMEARKKVAGHLQINALTSLPIISMMAVTVLGFGASFPVFTFINPILTTITGFSSQTTSALLVIFGLATLVGNMAGGRWATSLGWSKALRRMLVALALVLVVLVFAMPLQWLIMPLLFVWGILAFGMSPGFQAGMLETAQRWTPRSVDFASALNISGFNFGITLGESLGSQLVNLGQMAMTPWIGVGLALLALIPLWWVEKKNTSEVEPLEAKSTNWCSES